MIVRVNGIGGEKFVCWRMIALRIHGQIRNFWDVG